MKCPQGKRNSHNMNLNLNSTGRDQYEMSTKKEELPFESIGEKKINYFKYRVCYIS